MTFKPLSETASEDLTVVVVFILDTDKGISLVWAIGPYEFQAYIWGQNVPQIMKMLPQ